MREVDVDVHFGNSIRATLETLTEQETYELYRHMENEFGVRLVKIKFISPIKTHPCCGCSCGHCQNGHNTGDNHTEECANKFFERIVNSADEYTLDEMYSKARTYDSHFEKSKRQEQEKTK